MKENGIDADGGTLEVRPCDNLFSAMQLRYMEAA